MNRFFADWPDFSGAHGRKLQIPLRPQHLRDFFSPLFTSRQTTGPARCSHSQEYLALVPSEKIQIWAGRKRSSAFSWFLFFLGRGGLKFNSVMSGDQNRRFCVLSWDQVQRLDSILGEAVPIHGRGNFPTLSVQPRQIVQVFTQTLVLFIIFFSLFFDSSSKPVSDA